MKVLKTTTSFNIDPNVQPSDDNGADPTDVNLMLAERPNESCRTYRFKTKTLMYGRIEDKSDETMNHF